MGKKILIVTGSDYTEQVYQAFLDAKALGFSLFLLSDGSFSPKPGVFEKHFCYDLRRTKEALDYMAGQPYRFDAVTIKTSEWLTPLTALLAKQYGCIGNDPVTSFNCRSKYHMRKKLELDNVPGPKFRLCRTFDELADAARSIGMPCVAKPVGGNASYGTFMVRNEKDLKGLKEVYDKSIDYLKKKAVSEDMFSFSPEEMDLLGVKDHVDMVTDYLVEEFMSGPEISVDALVQDGKVTIMGVADQVRMQPPYFVQVAEKMPYVCSKERMDEIESLIRRTIKAMDIGNSATHTEIIFTPEGGKIVEIGCRIGGDNIHDAVFQTTGYNLMFESIMIALGEKRVYDIKTRCYTDMQYLLPDRNGIIREINLYADLNKDPDVTEINLFSRKGDEVAPPPESFDFIGYICVKGKTAEEAQKKLNESLKKIKIEFVK